MGFAALTPTYGEANPEAGAEVMLGFAALTPTYGGPKRRRRNGAAGTFLIRPARAVPVPLGLRLPELPAPGRRARHLERGSHPNWPQRHPSQAKSCRKSVPFRHGIDRSSVSFFGNEITKELVPRTWRYSGLRLPEQPLQQSPAPQGGDQKDLYGGRASSPMQAHGPA